MMFDKIKSFFSKSEKDHPNNQCIPGANITAISVTDYDEWTKAIDISSPEYPMLTPEERIEYEELKSHRLGQETRQAQRRYFANMSPKKRARIIDYLDPELDITTEIATINNLEAEPCRREAELSSKEFPTYIDPGFSWPFGSRVIGENGLIGKLSFEEFQQIHAQQLIEEALNDTN